MQIHELPSGSLTSSDVIAIDNGTSTRKYPLGSVLGKVTVRSISGTVDVASGETLVTQVIESTFPDAGTYLVICSLTFPANSSGTRVAGYAVDTTKTFTVTRSTSTMAASSGSSMLQCSGVETVAAAGTALRLYARQTSGSTLTVQYARITLIRLK